MSSLENLSGMVAILPMEEEALEHLKAIIIKLVALVKEVFQGKRRIDMLMMVS
jgi:hypothetical protein